MMNSAAADNDTGDVSAARDRRLWIATPLDTTRNSFRILKLLKGTGTMPIICDISVESLDDNPFYEALSYVWGDDKITKDIIVRGVTISVTVNLFEFLSVLRSPTTDKPVWADAICIDQTNDKEKTHQIGLMTRIYRNCRKAHIWFGHFTQYWEQEASHSHDYRMTYEMTAPMWEDYERKCLNNLRYFEKEDGFKPLTLQELRIFEKNCLDSIFLQTLTTLDKMADTKEHLHKYPVFFVNDGEGGDQKVMVNRSWLLVMDCVRWLLTRPWWTRVWTLQEAVLPRIDATVHAPPYSFSLSRLLSGISGILLHDNSSRCKWFGDVVLTRYRSQEGNSHFRQPNAIHTQREALKSSSQSWTPLDFIIESIQGRTARELCDHWYGILGILPPHWQEQDKECNGPWSAAELFSKCSKLLYSQSQNLTRLSSARKFSKCEVPDLPSWAIDLSAQRVKDRFDYQRWILYDAAPGTKFDQAKDWVGLKTPDLIIKAVWVGTVSTLGEPMIVNSREGSLSANTALEYVSHCRQLYRSKAQPANEDAFWRAIFMDRDIRRHWLHQRTQPLYGNRLADIEEWFHSWVRTRDNRDLNVDRKAGGLTRGSYHYNELARNLSMWSFFLIGDGFPAMGPHDVKADDNVYVVAGCNSPVVLRKKGKNGMGCFELVGLCFVDGWMYGRAMQGNSAWENVSIY